MLNKIANYLLHELHRGRVVFGHILGAGLGPEVVQVCIWIDKQDDGRVDRQAVQWNTDAGLKIEEVVGSNPGGSNWN